MTPDLYVHTKETDAHRGPVLRGTVKNVTELGMHGRRNFLAGREFISTVCQEEKERERKVSEG